MGTIGALGHSRIGRSVIEFLGHMEADPRLGFEKRSLCFASPMGIGWRVDPEARATEGLECFGVGCIEILDKGNRECVRDEGESLRDMEGPARKLGSISLGDKKKSGRLVRVRDANGKEFCRLANGELLPVV